MSGTGTTPSGSLFSLVRYRRYRAASQLRCALGIHRWRGHVDCGDGIHVAPISGYRRPEDGHSWRTCTWCGKHHISVRLSAEGWAWRGR